jgi:hypothetical protein
MEQVDYFSHGIIFGNRKQSPYPIIQIEWIDINPVETKDTGRLMHATATDRSKELKELLKDCSLSYQLKHNVFRIFI